jgi:hypothetical protein
MVVPKSVGAFTKGTEEASALLQMFVSGQLELTAAPGDVYPMFPSLRDKTSTQFRSGFHRVKEMARESINALSSSNGGKYF